MRYPSNFFEQLARWSLAFLFFMLPISLAVENVALAVFAACWLLAGHFKERWYAVRANPFLWPVLGLYVVVLLGATYTTGPSSDVFYHWGKYGKLVWITMAATLLVDAKTRARCWTAFTAAMVLTLAVTYANIWWDFPFTKTHNQGWGVDHSAFKDYIVQGTMTALLVVHSLRQAWRTPAVWMRWAWAGLAAAGLFANVFLLAGRTSYLATGAALGIFVLSLAKPRLRLAALAGLLLVAGAAVSLSPVMQERIAAGVSNVQNYHADVQEGNYTSLGQRMYFWEKSVQLIAERPLLGWGTGAYHQQFCRVADSPAWCEMGKFHPHNQFLFFAVDHGAIGLLLFVAIFAAAWLQSRRYAPEAKAVAWAFLGIFAVGSMTHGSLWLSNESFFYAFGLVLVMAATPASRGDQAERGWA